MARGALIGYTLKRQSSTTNITFQEDFNIKVLLISSKKRHGIVISERTLRNRLNEYGLRRRSPSSDINDVRRAMHELLNGPGNMGGYRSMWHALRTQGLQVPRRMVEQVVRELDPEGYQSRRAKWLRRHKIGSLTRRDTPLILASVPTVAYISCSWVVKSEGFTINNMAKTAL